MRLTLIRLAIVTGIFISTLTAGAQNFKDAIAVNDYFVSLTDSLYSGGRQWGQQFAKAYETKDYGTLAPVRKKLEKFIDSKLELLGKMKDSYGSENLRLATMDFLAYEKRLITEAFIPLEKLNKNSTDDEIRKALQMLSATAERETAEMARMNKAQEEFASKNGFTIEKK